MNEKTTIAVLLVIISIVASVGNGLVVFVILKKREWLKKVHSCLLLALAVQDILTAIGLLVLPGFVQSSKVYELPQSDMLGQIFCSLIWSRYIPFALAITSVYTCLMLALDRWVAVFRPMSYKQFSVSGKVIAVMVVVPWLAGFGFEVNTALHVDCRKESDGTRVCKWRNINSSAKNSCVAILTFLGMIVVPAILMILVYAKIVLRRKEQTARIFPQTIERCDSITAQNDESLNSTVQSVARTTKLNTSLKKLTIIACTASTIVIVCWLPDQFYFCLFQLNLVDLRSSWHDGLIILAFLNTCLNPFLYCFSSKQYASLFKSVLCCVAQQEPRMESVVVQADSETTKNGP